MLKLLGLRRSPSTDSLTLFLQVKHSKAAVCCFEEKKPRFRILVDLQSSENNKSLVMVFFPNALASHPWVTMFSHIDAPLTKIHTNRGRGEEKKERKKKKKRVLTVMTDSVVLRSSDLALLSGGRVDGWKSRPCAGSSFCSYKTENIQALWKVLKHLTLSNIEALESAQLIRSITQSLKLVDCTV